MNNILATLSDYRVITSRQAGSYQGDCAQQETSGGEPGQKISSGTQSDPGNAAPVFSSSALREEFLCCVRNAGKNQPPCGLSKWKTGTKRKSISVRLVPKDTAVGLRWVQRLQNILANMFDLPKVWGSVSPLRPAPLPHLSFQPGRHSAAKLQLGCSDCYTVFQGERLIPESLAHPLHHSTWAGKVPATRVARSAFSGG